MANADGHVGYFLRMDGRMRHAVHGSLGRTGRFSSVVARAATRYGRAHGVEHLSYRPVPARDARTRRSAIRTFGDRGVRARFRRRDGDQAWRADRGAGVTRHDRLPVT